MFLVPVNYLAVVLSAVLAMVIGFLWYGPIFGKQWMSLVGMTDKKAEEAKKDMTKTYGLMFVSSLVMAWILVHFIWYAAPGSVTMTIGLKTAFWAWLGMVATTFLSKHLFSPDKKPLTLYLIDTGYYLAVLLGMAVVIVLLG